MEIIDTLDKPNWLDISNYSWWIKLIIVLLVLRISSELYRWFQYRQSQRRVMRIKAEMGQFPLSTTPTIIYNRKLNEKRKNSLVDFTNDAINETRLLLTHIKDILLSYII